MPDEVVFSEEFSWESASWETVSYSSEDFLSTILEALTGVMWIEIGVVGCWVNRTFLTLKLAEELLAMKALPKHIASSPFRCTPKSFPPNFWINISWTLGTRIPPPRISTWSIYSIVSPALVKASSIGTVTRLKKSAAASSNSLRSIWELKET